jgi:hemolysin III
MNRSIEAFVRPRLRGRLHQIAVFVSLAGLVWIVSSAPTARAAAAAWVYAVAAVLLYLASSTYHVFARSPGARKIMQRIDHSMIYVLIAGSFTPAAVLAIHDPWRWPSLAVMWVGALTGVGLKVFGFDRFRKFGSALYILLGWAGLMAFPELVHRPAVLALIAGGGVLYTVGAVLFSMQRPRLSPRWFGYHEVWHTFVVTAGACMFAANLGLVRTG